MASVVLSVFLVNLRYLLMSSAMSVFFREQTTLQKIVSGLLLTDETFGVAVQRGGHQGTVPFAWMFGLNLAAWLNWILACVVGGCLASALPPALMEGLSFSLVSMFIGLVLMIWFASRQKKTRNVQRGNSGTRYALCRRSYGVKCHCDCRRFSVGNTGYGIVTRDAERSEIRWSEIFY